tara:strand:- start:5585 stop:6028 length:444 start_codon:yes stop_codon:yes gene_type:complete
MKYTSIPYVDLDAEYWDSVKALDAANLLKLQQATKQLQKEKRAKQSQSLQATRHRVYIKTEKGLASSLSNQIKASDKRRQLNSINWNTATFRSWLINNKEFSNIFNTWMSAKYATPFKPVIQRIDISKGYTLDNMSVVMSKNKVYEK